MKEHKSMIIKKIFKKKEDDLKPDIKDVIKYQQILKKIKEESSKVIVGQEQIINGIIRGILCGGHVLLEGIPGIAKTLIIRTFAAVTGGKYSRIQFTADLLPSDITGLVSYNKEKDQFVVVKGPVFANYVIADEVNRAPPKTQSAILEAMQENQVTIGNNTYHLPKPFFVMATQNPIDSSGVYQLPEAQLDRFLFKVQIYYPRMEDENEILKKNITLKRFEEFYLKKISNPQEIVQMQEFTKKIYLSKAIEDYIIRIVDATRHPQKYKISSGHYIDWGCSPRASIGLFIAAKAEAILHGSNYVIPLHIKNVACDVMRHRILLNYEGQAENIKTDDIIKEILQKVPSP